MSYYLVVEDEKGNEYRRTNLAMAKTNDKLADENISVLEWIDKKTSEYAGEKGLLAAIRNKSKTKLPDIPLHVRIYTKCGEQLKTPRPIMYSDMLDINKYYNRTLTNKIRESEFLYKLASKYKNLEHLNGTCSRILALLDASELDSEVKKELERLGKMLLQKICCDVKEKKENGKTTIEYVLSYRKVRDVYFYVQELEKPLISEQDKQDYEASMKKRAEQYRYTTITANEKPMTKREKLMWFLANEERELLDPDNFNGNEDISPFDCNHSGKKHGRSK